MASVSDLIQEIKDMNDFLAARKASSTKPNVAEGMVAGVIAKIKL